MGTFAQQLLWLEFTTASVVVLLVALALDVGVKKDEMALDFPTSGVLSFWVGSAPLIKVGGLGALWHWMTGTKWLGWNTAPGLLSKLPSLVHNSRNTADPLSSFPSTMPRGLITPLISG